MFDIGDWEPWSWNHDGTVRSVYPRSESRDFDLQLKQLKQDDSSETEFNLGDYFDNCDEPEFLLKLDQFQVTNGKLLSLIRYIDPSVTSCDDYHAYVIDDWDGSLNYVRFFENGTSLNERYVISPKREFNLNDYIDKPELLTFGEECGEVLHIHKYEVSYKSDPNFLVILKVYCGAKPQAIYYKSDGVHEYSPNEFNLRLK